MEKFLSTLLAITLVVSFSLNVYLLGESKNEFTHKTTVLELEKKKNDSNDFAERIALQDSINNAILSWLQDGKSK